MICPVCQEYTSTRYPRCPTCGNPQPKTTNSADEDYISESVIAASETVYYEELRF